jgi:hypothetical protein
MPPWVWTAALAALQALLLLLFKLWQNAEDAKHKEIIRGLREDIVRLEQWTKDKEKFDYEFRHDEYGRAITGINEKLWPAVTKIEALEKETESLREWKHMVIDPYIPRAIDEHERRINRLDQKVFNGNK